MVFDFSRSRCPALPDIAYPAAVCKLLHLNDSPDASLGVLLKAGAFRKAKLVLYFDSLLSCMVFISPTFGRLPVASLDWELGKVADAFPFSSAFYVVIGEEYAILDIRYPSIPGLIFEPVPRSGIDFKGQGLRKSRIMVCVLWPISKDHT